VHLLNVVIKDRQVRFIQSCKQHHHPKHHCIFEFTLKPYSANVCNNGPDVFCQESPRYIWYLFTWKDLQINIRGTEKQQPMFYFVAVDFKAIFPILLRDILTEALECVSGAVADCGENCRRGCDNWLNRRLLPLLFLVISGVSNHSGSPNPIKIASFICSHRYTVNI